jgi:predicted nucleic acid-binding protein
VKPVLVDTGCIVALLDRSEQYHQECAEALAAIEAPLLTCEPVIAESCYLLRDVAGAGAKLLENIDRGVLELPYRLAQRAASLTKLMAKYGNVPMDLADACLVDMAAEFQTARIMTLDGDFRIYRWGKNRPFELLLEL